MCLCGAGDDDEEEDGDDDEEEDGDDGSDTEDEAYAVESIVSHRGAGRKREYLVKWVGYADPTWQPMRDFDGNSEYLSAYVAGIVDGLGEME